MNHTSLFFKTFFIDNLASPSFLGLLHSCVWITWCPAHTLYFFMNSSTVVKSLCTCLKAALYCTSSLEQVAVYLFTQVEHQWRNVYLEQVAVYLFNRWNINEQTFTWSKWLCICLDRWNINEQMFTWSRRLCTWSYRWNINELVFTWSRWYCTVHTDETSVNKHLLGLGAGGYAPVYTGKTSINKRLLGCVPVHTGETSMNSLLGAGNCLPVHIVMTQVKHHWTKVYWEQQVHKICYHCHDIFFPFFFFSCFLKLMTCHHSSNIYMPNI